MKKKARLPGFSLLEVSISLVIIGIISSIGISQLKSVLKFNATQKTQANIDYIVKTIGAYYLLKKNIEDKAQNFIPYPSNEEKNIGYEDVEMSENYGIVPFKTLGIPEKFAKNGNGKWFKYKINPRFTKSVANKQQRALDIENFDSDIPDDKVAIIIKSMKEDGGEDFKIWFSEKSFIANFANNKFFFTEEKKVSSVGMRDDINDEVDLKMERKVEEKNDEKYDEESDSSFL